MGFFDRLFSQKTSTLSGADNLEYGPDGFHCGQDDPLKTEHDALSALLNEQRDTTLVIGKSADMLRRFPHPIEKADATARARFIEALVIRLWRLERIERHQDSPKKYPPVSGGAPRKGRSLVFQHVLAVLGMRLFKKKMPVSKQTQRILLEWCSDSEELGFRGAGHLACIVVTAAEQLIEADGQDPDLLGAIGRFRGLLSQGSGEREYRHLIARLEVLEGTPLKWPIQNGEAWADAALSAIQELSHKQQCSWLDCISLARNGMGAVPSLKWQAAMRKLVGEIGPQEFSSFIASWFPLTASGKADTEANRRAWLAHCVAEVLGNHWMQLCERVPADGPSIWDAIDQWKEEAAANGDAWKWLRDFANQQESENVTTLFDVPATPPIYVPANDLLIEPHMDILRGLAWACGLFPSPELARALTTLALSAYRKVPGKGPRAVRVGNACITGLAMMGGLDAVGQLAVLKVKVKFGTAQIAIEKALRACAEKSGIPRDELEEMSVPAYGLTEVGSLVEPLGECSAELRIVDSREVALIFRGADGKERKALPAAVKEQFREELKELSAAKKDIEKMLPAQAERLDALFLAQKTWALEAWLERYAEHPLVGALARRLIWNFSTGGITTAGVWFDGKFVDRSGVPVPLDVSQTRVSLWHPLGEPADIVLAWRVFLEERRIRQPFKQAHREIYLLTPAEAATVTYSNRFAAHLLRQHQFNSLCATRGWKNKLRLMVDDSYPPPTRRLPQWGLRAEFWIESAGDNFGTDTNESGVYLHVATDQVRFYPLEAAQVSAHASGGGYEPGWQETAAEPLRLVDVPAMVFSEIMRDVDLFVGVGSVGNDPAWADGGRREADRGEWGRFAFGDLSAMAKTRRDVLERLVPKLKIAALCSFEEKFLVVRGKLRTYKIHLGSGNILMSPNDQYLCIVPSRGKADSTGIFLPFEGDGVLSLIISKALLLAADDKITDPSITRQIRA